MKSWWQHHSVAVAIVSALGGAATAWIAKPGQTASHYCKADDATIREWTDGFNAFLGQIQAHERKLTDSYRTLHANLDKTSVRFDRWRYDQADAELNRITKIQQLDAFIRETRAALNANTLKIKTSWPDSSKLASAVSAVLATCPKSG